MAEGAGELSSTRFARDGAELFSGLAADRLGPLATLFDHASIGAGFRLADPAALQFIGGAGSPIARRVADLIGGGARMVRAIAFDKSPASNWALGWHQDRTICVRERAEVAGYGPWTIKQGLHHVQPPFAITERMATVRIHLDPVTSNNAPLRVALETHRLGQIADAEAQKVADAHEMISCEAEAGDVWIYATPILHASDRSTSGNRRRVLQLDFSSATLPPPLEWLLG